MYYVRNSSNTLISGIIQNRSISQIDSKTKKNLIQSNKTKPQTNNQQPNKPYFSKLDIDVKKVSNGLSMGKQYLRTETSNNTIKSLMKFRKKTEFQVSIDNNANKTSANFFKSNPNLTQIDEKESFQKIKNVENITNLQNKICERNVHTSQGFRIKQLSIEYMNQLQSNYCNRAENLKKSRELKEKMMISDPFFLKKPDFAEDKFRKERENCLNGTKTNYYNSDVFLSKPFDLVNDKTIDKFIIANHNQKFYSSSNKSRSEWSPQNSKTNLLNHTSVPYSIFNEGVKTFVKTKEEIFKERNDSPAKKQKSLGEFADLVRVYSPNPNKEYLSALEKSTTTFHRNSNICANYHNLHRLYGSLCEKPFVKKTN